MTTNYTVGRRLMRWCEIKILELDRGDPASLERLRFIKEMMKAIDMAVETPGTRDDIFDAPGNQ